MFLRTMNLCLSKVNIHSLSHNFPIEMRLEWRLQKTSACFACLDKIIIGIYAWCMDGIADELVSFTLIEFSDGSLLWTIVVRASR